VIAERARTTSSQAGEVQEAVTSVQEQAQVLRDIIDNS
jgi:hypothetical protein